MSTLLTDLVRKQTAMTVVATLSRSVDSLAEEMARELLRDPEFRADLQQLVRVALKQSLKELNEPAPPPQP